MSSWSKLVRLPATLDSEAAFGPCFRQIADYLLLSSRLCIHQVPHRLTEVECYYVSDAHPDPFAHRHSTQKRVDRWYLHRSGEGLKNGTYKGLDLTFGNHAAFGGILFRGVCTPDDQLIDGPSLLVDYVLRQTQIDTVHELNRQLLPRNAWDAGSPVYLARLQKKDHAKIWQSSRIGMSLKRRDHPDERLRFFFKQYRFLTEPRRIRKGKLSLCLNMYLHGVPLLEIQELTGSPRRTLDRYLADFEAGKNLDDPHQFLGRELAPKEVCALYGCWEHSRMKNQLAH